MRELYFAAEMRARSTRETDFAGRCKDAPGDSFILCSGTTRTLQPNLRKRTRREMAANMLRTQDLGIAFPEAPAVCTTWWATGFRVFRDRGQGRSK